MISGSLPSPFCNPPEFELFEEIRNLKNEMFEVSSTDAPKFSQLSEESQMKVKMGINRFYKLFAKNVLARPDYQKDWAKQIATSGGKIFHEMPKVFNNAFLDSIAPVFDSFGKSERAVFAARLTFQLSSFFGPFHEDKQHRQEFVKIYANTGMLNLTL